MVANSPLILQQIKQCTLCEQHLPHGVRPVLSIGNKAKIVICGQAPGRKVHESGIPFDDASGHRLREWMGISREQFYNEDYFAIIPMGFCYSGQGKSGDLPPRPECQKTWHKPLFEALDNFELKLLIGQYAQQFHLTKPHKLLTDNVKNWEQYAPTIFPLPHPSPRNNIWLKKNSWFEKNLIPILKERILSIYPSLAADDK